MVMTPPQALLDVLNIPLSLLRQHRDLTVQVVRLLNSSLHLENVVAAPASNNPVGGSKRKRSTAPRRAQINHSQSTSTEQPGALARRPHPISPSTETVLPHCQAQGQITIRPILNSIDRHRGDVEGLLRLDPTEAVGRTTTWETAEPRLLDLMSCDKDPESTPQKWLRNMLSQLSYAKSFLEWKQKNPNGNTTTFGAMLKVANDQKELVYCAILTGLKLVKVDENFNQIHTEGSLSPQFKDAKVAIHCASSLLLCFVSKAMSRLRQNEIEPLARSLYESEWNGILLGSTKWLADCIHFYEGKFPSLQKDTILTRKVWQRDFMTRRFASQKFVSPVLQAYEGDPPVGPFVHPVPQTYQWNLSVNSFDPRMLEGYQRNPFVDSSDPRMPEGNLSVNSFDPRMPQAYQGNNIPLLHMNLTGIAPAEGSGGYSFR